MSNFRTKRTFVCLGCARRFKKIKTERKAHGKNCFFFKEERTDKKKEASYIIRYASYYGGLRSYMSDFNLFLANLVGLENKGRIKDFDSLAEEFLRSEKPMFLEAIYLNGELITDIPIKKLLKMKAGLNR